MLDKPVCRAGDWNSLATGQAGQTEWYHETGLAGRRAFHKDETSLATICFKVKTPTTLQFLQYY